MYGKLTIGLAALVVLLLLGIIGIVGAQDYRSYGDFSPGRAVGNAGGRLAAGWFQWEDAAGDREAGSVAVAVELRSNQFYPAVGEELRAAQEFMLALINADRERFGRRPLGLGNNTAAQSHAAAMARHNFRSHWGLDGLTPYMRYTRAGGFNRELENIAGPEPWTGPAESGGQDLAGALTRAQQGMMGRPAQQANILDRWHRKVNLGVACTAAACWVAQQFEGDYALFEELPAIAAGKLSFAGRLADGMELDGAAVWYHPPPRALTLGQLDATYSYSLGQYPAALLRPPAAVGSQYSEGAATYGWQGGIDPYTLEPALGRSESPPLAVAVSQRASVPWITATVWETGGSDFRVAADLTPVLESSGDGVYTVQIWGKVGTERAALTNYAIFVEG